MYRIIKLTTEQRVLAEKYHGLIFTSMKSLGIPKGSYDNFYGAAAEALCKAASKYISRNEDTKSFGSFARDIIKKAVIDEFRKENAAKRVPFDQIDSIYRVIGTEEDKFLQLIDMIPDKNDFENNFISIYTVTGFIRTLNGRERKIVIMLLQGFRYQDIASAEGISKSCVQQTVKKLRKKYIMKL